MKAVRIHEFGDPDVIRIDDIDRPRPREKQILVKVAGSSVNPVDLSLRSGEMKLIAQFQLPKTLGFELAGEIVECGSGVTSFLPGDRVVAMTGMAASAAAEYCCVDQENATLLPDELAWPEAAAVPLAGATALQALRGIAHLRKGQRLLINGASGGVGSYAVQIAKLLEAHVTAVCSEERFDHVRQLGADETFDYKTQDLSELGEKFDIVFDAAAKLSVDKIKGLVHHGGHAVTTRPAPKQVVESLVERLRGSFKLSFMMVRPRAGDIALLMRLLKEGRLQPCLAKTFPLEQAADAHRHLEDESVPGKIVLVSSAEAEDNPSGTE